MNEDMCKVGVLSNAEAVNIGCSLDNNIAAYLASLFTSAIIIVTDVNVAELHLQRLVDAATAAIAANNTKIITYILPPGELTKSREYKALVENYLFSQGCTRDSILVALGGGVVGDLTGYIAATYMRGIKYIQIPTTLLAMVDSSIGGKTAIDVPAGKNLIGAFWQPIRIFIDLNYLTTLPEREFINGMGEVIKTAAIWSEQGFTFIENNVENVFSTMDRIRKTNKLLSEDVEMLKFIVLSSVRVKAHVVSTDERESGLRGLLNFGHTIGHAIEAILAPELLHGECVSIGMILEAEVAHQLGILTSAALRRLIRCCASYGLPVALDDTIVCQRIKGEHCDMERMMTYMTVDKKNTGTEKCIVLLKCIGDTYEKRASNVQDDIIRYVISSAVRVYPLSLKPISTTELHEHPCIVHVPGSKSISNRALILAALGKGQCRIHNLLHSDDTKYMLNALRQLGACHLKWEDDGDTLVLNGNGGYLQHTNRPLYLGNAGTAARFLTSIVTLISLDTTITRNLSSAEIILTGNARMKERPIGPLVDALRANGCNIMYKETEGCLPLSLHPNENASGGLPGGIIELSASISSQYVSSILLAAPYAQQPVTLKLVDGHVISQPYIDMTIAMMRAFGVHVQRIDSTTYMIPLAVYQNPPEYVIEPDASSATYPLAVAAITGTTVIIPHLGRQSLQGDAQFAKKVIEPMGGQVLQTDTETRVTGPPRGELYAIPTINMESMTDAFLTASILAAVAIRNNDSVSQLATTTITGITNQRVKECNRIKTMVTELAKFGVSAQELSDGIEITGISLNNIHPPQDGVVCNDDHRVAMAFSVLATVTSSSNSEPDGVVIREKRCVEKTWPNWWHTLSHVLKVHVEGVQFKSSLLPNAVIKNPNNCTSSDLRNATVVLIGMRGAGKTHLGQTAASSLQRVFIDLDNYFMQQQEMSINDFITQHGWETFRALEIKYLDDILGRYPTNAIVACGGGIVETINGRNLLEKTHHGRNKLIVHVTRPISDILAYLSQDQIRPAWGEDMMTVWRRRQPYYTSLAQYEFHSVTNGEMDWQKVNADFAHFLCFILSKRTFKISNTRQTSTASTLSSFLSLTFPTIEQALPYLSMVTVGVKAIELRVDLLQSYELTFVAQQLFLLKRHTLLPIIFTVRSASQAGHFPDALSNDMFELLKHAAKWAVEIIDVEITHGQERINHLVQFLRGNKHISSPSMLLASFHDQHGDLGWNNPLMMQRLLTAKKFGDALKLVSYARCLQDNYTLDHFITHIANTILSIPLISINMGRMGQLSRITNCFLTPVTHPALPIAAAPGQLSVAEIHQARHLLGMLPKRIFYLFGCPISMSMSPILHNTGFDVLGLPYRYELFETRTLDYSNIDQESIVNRNDIVDARSVQEVIRTAYFGGASITIPHKEKAMKLLVDRVTPAALRIGAINTIYKKEDNDTTVLVGDNTDYQGIMTTIHQRSVKMTTRCALVIGAGGTARAAIYALQIYAKTTSTINTIYVYNRTRTSVQRLIDDLQDDNNAVIVMLEELSSLKAVDIIISTIPAEAQTLLLKLGEVAIITPIMTLLASQPLVIDMAYRPRKTPLMQAHTTACSGAELANIQIYGIEVLIEQGLHQFELWTGLRAPKKIIVKKVYETYVG